MANRNWNGDWDSLGRTIGDIVDQAVNSQNYRQLNETICDVLARAVDGGSEALRRAVDSGSAAVKKEVQNAQDRRKYTVEPKKPAPMLYAGTAGRSAGGILKTVFGSLIGFGSGAGALTLTILGILGIGPGLISFPGILLSVLGIGGVSVFAGGVGSLTRLARFRQYAKLLGSSTHIRLEQLARSIGKSEHFVRRDVQKMIADGLFLEGHLDNEGTQLITSHETFESYEASRLELEARRALEQSLKPEKVKDAQLQAVLDRGNAFVAEIRRCNERIPGQEISTKISRMEELISKIFRRAEEHPEIIPDLKKLMDYYLPMTVKLLNAYAEMDSLGVEGQTVSTSKQEIEATLDTLNNAFEKLLDSIFRRTAMDVSSDISVLQTLLSQEGLTDDGFGA